MSLETVILLTAFAFAATWTPGPNNIMLANSGANYGFRRTLPHIMGVAWGFAVMNFCIALGLGKLFEIYPIFRETLKWLGAAMLLYLAYRIATAGRANAKSRGRPLSFIEACGFQWVNPKGWSTSIGATATFLTGQNPLLEATIAFIAFAIAGNSSAATWTAFGMGIRRFLSTDLRLRIFNIAMGLMVAACVIFLFLDDL